jgi:competence protein ComEA
MENKIGSRRISALVLAAAATVALAALAAQAHASGKDDTPPATGVVNLNTATEGDLVQLPGIGASKAQAILTYRAKNGAFKKVEDLTRVRGFGWKTLKKLRPFLALTGATTYRGKKSAPADDAAPPREGFPTP